ncbi:MAG TPA: Fe-S cluster assembly protein SufD [Gammaproteobacteria bacterium]|nr:Fe-S cluster assembly protein SufD [Gammaproteobacteria bacterium]
MQQAVVEQGNPYGEHFRARRKERMGEPVWLIERRTAAMQAFESQGFPTRKHEAWRNLDLAPVSKAHFPPVHLVGEVDEQVEAIRQVIPDAHLLVLVDGHLSDAHSALGDLPAGVTLRPLIDALQSHDALLEAHLGKYAPVNGHAFAALSTALFEGGVLVHVGRGVALERPLVIAYLVSANAEQRAVYPRTLIVAEEGAEIRVAEFHRGGAGVYLNCPVTEIVAADNAAVHYHSVQESGPDAFHFGVIAGHLERDARISAHSFAIGGKLARADLYGDLAAPGGEVALDGLYLLSDGQYIDHHTWVSHLAEHCQSHQLFKGVLAGRSEAVFDGLVKVAKGAQKTDARQENRNLLLTRRAKVHSNPRLEIHADDVKCTHGSSMGELDEDALFYLRSRGIGRDDAMGLLTYAFIGEALEPVRIDALREYERAVALRYLPGDHAAREML